MQEEEKENREKIGNRESSNNKLKTNIAQRVCVSGQNIKRRGNRNRNIRSREKNWWEGNSTEQANTNTSSSVQSLKDQSKNQGATPSLQEQNAQEYIG